MPSTRGRSADAPHEMGGRHSCDKIFQALLEMFTVPTCREGWNADFRSWRRRSAACATLDIAPDVISSLRLDLGSCSTPRLAAQVGYYKDMTRWCVWCQNSHGFTSQCSTQAPLVSKSHIRLKGGEWAKLKTT